MWIRFCLAIAALAAFAPLDAEAGLISYYNFNNNASTATLLTASQGNGSLTTSFSTANVTNFTGTTNNALNGDPAGTALALQDGTGNVNDGHYLQLLTSSVGNTNLMISFAIQATNTGFQSDQLQYTTDGGLTFTNFGAAFQPVSSTVGFGSAGGVQAFDLSSIATLNNNANAGFRIVFNLGGVAGSSSGNNRIDNLQVNGTALVNPVPEPASVALLGLGLVGFAPTVRRKRA